MKLKILNPKSKTCLFGRQVPNLNWFYFIGALFIALNVIFIYNDFLWFNLLPVALILAGISFFSLDKLILFIVFCTPLSVNLEELEFGFGISLPSEPLMFGAMLIFFFRVFYENDFDRKILTHPISLVIIINLIWLFFTVITSEMPLISFKHTLARLWFVVCYYFIATQVFREKKNIYRFLWLFIVPLAAVVIYTISQHAVRGFEEKPAHWVMQPFFKDHTSYGAILAMIFPVIIGSLFSKQIQFTAKFLIFILLLVVATGLVFSYTRAAWLSLLVALGVFLLFVFKIKFRTIAISSALLLVLFLYFRQDIFMTLEKNRQDASADFAEHAQSVTNIASDASNLERINRWNCALRMFAERPFTGWGPGTYQFLYAPYQQSGDLTIISTNFGDRGNAHSEYLGPLAESGILGALTFLAIIISVFYTGSKLYFKLQDRELKIVVLSVLLGLTTYVAHGILNNFLDTDKAAVPFWGFIAIIVAVERGQNSIRKIRLYQSE